jgi:hypothetical protein
VLFGPQELRGAEFSRLFIKQGIAQTQYFVTHWRIHSTIGKFMKCALLAWIELSLGVFFSLLERMHVSGLRLFNGLWLQLTQLSN